MNKQQVLDLFVDDVEARRAMVREYLTDHSHSYEDRKEVFMNTPDHLYTREPWVMSLPEYENVYPEVSWYDDFGIERYTEVDLIQVCKDVQLGFNNDSVESPEDFIKAIVNNGIHSFTFDW